MSKGGKKIVIVKKKKGHGHGHHGGSWKVAYADFVTAMMAFFMVMWILGMDDKTKQAIEGYFSNPIGYKKGYSSGSSPMSNGAMPISQTRNVVKLVVRNAEQKKFEALAERIRQRLDENDALRKLQANFEVTVTNEGLRIELIEGGAGDIFFARGSATMNAPAVLSLSLIAEELASLSHPIVLEGHTDAAAFGTTDGYTNWELSADRANAARRLLAASAVGAQRITEVRGYAATRPRVPTDPLAAANRRISVLLPFTQVPQPVEDAKSLPDAAARDQYETEIAREAARPRTPAARAQEPKVTE
ncbi:MAG: OmpA family protein [Gemmatimonadaceae bacterium]|jgi:chemotaxis protein MotB|nr:OmpA family protein [Gemmatimonadaceae bacterium]